MPKIGPIRAYLAHSGPLFQLFVLEFLFFLVEKIFSFWENISLCAEFSREVSIFLAECERDWTGGNAPRPRTIRPTVGLKAHY